MSKMILAIALMVFSFQAQAGKSSPDCTRARCPKKYVHCEADEKKINVAPKGACCPIFKCVPKKAPDCTRAACVTGMPHCDEGEVLNDIRDPGACCPKWTCDQMQTNEGGAE